MQINPNQIISISAMCKNLNKGRSTLFVWVRDGHFPQPIRVGKKTLGWTTKQYQSWLESKEAANHE
ncbi:hypothetical protein TUM4641_25800 [Shewanella morhuae]|nr:hypothetical protein TUM4641_25800 [Shewanella morhuae]